ncbi:MAG: hypothetical protein JJE53_00315 [Candidatus Pacebacteria bacterium]|nr:hypothetical protein [Candidatus Paceibacterota bacterium]
MNNFKNYLPSKKFITIVLFILVIILLFFTIKGAITFFSDKDGSKDKPIELTIETLLQEDGNKNGISDWEERIWGLDPFENGPENKEFILAKKKTLEQNGIITISDDSKAITENDLLSRQFFATIMSLQQTGQLDDEAINSISSSIGQTIKPTNIPDVYTRDMLNIQKDSDESDTEYFFAFIGLLEKYQDSDLGSELTLVSQGIVDQDPQALYAARTVATAYRLFGRELISIPVPSSAALSHMSLSNNYEKVAQSVEGLTQIITDPIIGMRALLNYKKYTDAIGSDFEILNEILQ